MFGGKCDGPFATSMVQLAGHLHNAGISFTFATILNESNVGRARDNLAKMFLESPCSHLLFVDADIEFNPTDVIRMLAEDEPIIGGAYTKKTIRWEKIKNAIKAGAPAKYYPMYAGEFAITLMSDQLQIKGDENPEVRWLATGFLLIKREVFDNIKKLRLTKYQTVYDDQKHTLTEFFPYPIIDGIKLTEDYGFSELARQAGHKLKWATYVHLTHWGTYGFSGDFLASHATSVQESSKDVEHSSSAPPSSSPPSTEIKPTPPSVATSDLSPSITPEFCEDICGTQPAPLRLVSSATSDKEDTGDTK